MKKLLRQTCALPRVFVKRLIYRSDRSLTYGFWLRGSILSSTCRETCIARDMDTDMKASATFAHITTGALAAVRVEAIHPVRATTVAARATAAVRAIAAEEAAEAQVVSVQVEQHLFRNRDR